jgi:NADPH-dependent curcumin reductase CurA
MKGFALLNEASSIPAAIAWLFYYYQRGLLKLPEHVENGIENFAMAMVMMFNGSYIGRTIIDVAGVK